MSKYRYTVETLAAGQPRAYADTIHHVRVTFEQNVPWGEDPAKRNTWQPKANMTEEAVKSKLKNLMCGFTDFKYPAEGVERSMENHYRTRLDWLKEVEPGIWEFHTTSPFTD